MSVIFLAQVFHIRSPSGSSYHYRHFDDHLKGAAGVTGMALLF